MRSLRCLLGLFLIGCAPAAPEPSPEQPATARGSTVHPAVARGGARPFTAATNGDCSQNMHANSGLAIANARVFNIYWGTYWSDAKRGLRKADWLTAAWSDLANNPLFYTPLIQYGAGFGSFAGAYTYYYSDPPLDPNGWVAESAITNLIQYLVQNVGGIPAEDDNTIYMVYLPPGFLSDYDLNRKNRFYGHHRTFNDQVNNFNNVRYAVIDPDSALMPTASHEIIETITDPDLSSWGSDVYEGEIGDICNDNPRVKLDGYVLNAYWSNANCACIGPLQREVVDGTVAAFQAIDATTVYVLGYDRNLWVETNNSATRTWLGSSVHSFQAVGDHLWVLDFNNTLWYEQPNNPSSFYPVASNVERFKAAGGVAFFMKYNDRNLYRGWAGWSGDVVDGNVLDFQPVDVTDVYVLGTDRKLWLEYPGPNTPRTFIDGNVASFQAADGLIYVLGTDLKLWRETPGQGHGPNPVDANVGHFYPLDSTFVFVSGNVDGRIWREDGDYTRRDFVDANAIRFQPIDRSTLYVLGSGGYLWREHLPQYLP